MNGLLDPRIIVLSSDLESRRRLAKILNDEGIDPVCSPSIDDCQEFLTDHDVNLVFCDSNLVDGTYRDLLRAAPVAKRRVKVVVTSRSADWDEYLAAVRFGAFDVIPAPCQPTDVEWVISQMLRAQRNEGAAHRIPEAPGEAQVH